MVMDVNGNLAIVDNQSSENHETTFSVIINKTTQPKVAGNRLKKWRVMYHKCKRKQQASNYNQSTIHTTFYIYQYITH